MDKAPKWLETFLESVSCAIESTGTPDSMGYEYLKEEDLWHVDIFPMPVEVVKEGELDYGIPGFTSDIEAIRSVFEKIEDISWTAHNFGTGESDKPVVSVEGEYDKHKIFLQILSDPPTHIEPKYRVITDKDGTKIEKIVEQSGEELSFGAVVITGGENKGKIGYYDDDEGRFGIVYFGKPFQSEYELIPRKHLRNITSLEHEKFKRENPEFCVVLGID